MVLALSVLLGAPTAGIGVLSIGAPSRVGVGPGPTATPDREATVPGPSFTGARSASCPDKASLASTCPPAARSEVGTAGNSSTGEVGGVAATASYGRSPYGIAVDPATGYVYETNAGSDNVTVLDGSELVRNVTVGDEPEGAVYDPSDGDMYIMNYGSNSTTVLRGTSVVTTISNSTFDGPYQGTYDPLDQCIYVTDVNSNDVSVINGTTVTASVTVGTYPFGGAFDPETGELYFTNDASVVNGGASVSIVQGTSVVATVGPSGSEFVNPSGIVYDPLDGRLYVANKDIPAPTDGFLTVLDGNGTLAGTIRAFQDPFDLLFDPANSLLYVAGSDNDLGSQSGFDRLTALGAGGAVEGNITVGANTHFIAYDPVDEAVYTANTESDNVSVVGTELAEGPIVAAPDGSPSGSQDIGQSVVFITNVSAAGAGGLKLTVSTSPSNLLTCTAPVLAYNVTGGVTAVECRGSSLGSGLLWLNLTDRSGATVWSRTPWTVFADPTLPTPQARTAGGTRILAGDVGETVTFSVLSGGFGAGSGFNGSVVWSGLPSGCVASLAYATNMTCPSLPAETSLNISANFTDRNGVNATSPTLTFVVDPGLSVVAVQASRNPIAADEKVVLTALPSGGSDDYVGYAWIGLSQATCTGLTTSTPTCEFPDAGAATISASVTDSNGNTSGYSGSYTLAIDPALTLGSIELSAADVVVDGGVTISVPATGGAGGVSFAWTDLPPGCGPTNGSQIACDPTTPGTYHISVTGTDAGGGTAGSGPVTLVVSPPSSSTTRNTIAGLSYVEFGAIVAGVVLVAAVVVALVLRARRPGRGIPPPPPAVAPTR